MTLSTISRFSLPIQSEEAVELDVGEGYEILGINLTPEAYGTLDEYFDVWVKQLIGSAPHSIRLRVTCQGFVYDDAELRHIKTVTDSNMHWHIFQELQT